MARVTLPEEVKWKAERSPQVMSLMQDLAECNDEDAREQLHASIRNITNRQLFFHALFGCDVSAVPCFLALPDQMNASQPLGATAINRSEASSLISKARNEVYKANRQLAAAKATPLQDPAAQENLEQAQRRFEEASRNVPEMYFSLNSIKAGESCNAGNIERFNAFFVEFSCKTFGTPDELDRFKAEVLSRLGQLPQYSALTETQTGYNVFWFIDDLMRTRLGLKRWVQVETALVDAAVSLGCGADPAVKEPACLLRLPGSNLVKPAAGDAGGFFVRFAEINGTTCNPEELLAVLSLPATAAETGATADKQDCKSSCVSIGELLARNVLALSVLMGNTAHARKLQPLLRIYGALLDCAAGSAVNSNLEQHSDGRIFAASKSYLASISGEPTNKAHKKVILLTALGIIEKLPEGESPPGRGPSGRGSRMLQHFRLPNIASVEAMRLIEGRLALWRAAKGQIDLLNETAVRRIFGADVGVLCYTRSSHRA